MSDQGVRPSTGSNPAFLQVAHRDGTTETASRLVWWLVSMATTRMGCQPQPKVGDIVVETSHVLGMARHRLGLLSAVGELIAIEKDDRLGILYTIRTVEGKEQRWENACVVTIESSSPGV